MPGVDIHSPKQNPLHGRSVCVYHAVIRGFCTDIFSLRLSQCQRTILVGLLWEQKAWDHRSKLLEIRVKLANAGMQLMIIVLLDPISRCK